MNLRSKLDAAAQRLKADIISDVFDWRHKPLQSLWLSVRFAVNVFTWLTLLLVIAVVFPLGVNFLIKNMANATPLAKFVILDVFPVGDCLIMLLLFFAFVESDQPARYIEQSLPILLTGKFTLFSKRKDDEFAESLLNRALGNADSSVLEQALREESCPSNGDQQNQ